MSNSRDSYLVCHSDGPIDEVLRRLYCGNDAIFRYIRFSYEIALDENYLLLGIATPFSFSPFPRSVSIFGHILRVILDGRFLLVLFGHYLFNFRSKVLVPHCLLSNYIPDWSFLHGCQTETRDCRRRYFFAWSFPTTVVG